MKRIHCYSGWIVCCIIIVVIGYFCWHGPVTTVILVRHAEKEAFPPDDPPLSPEGVLRAQTLAHVVADAGIDVIFATDLIRTQATVVPAAADYGITPIIIPSTNTGELVSAINSEHRGKEILVAGHSNTIPGIMEALGISAPPVITDSDYDDLFVINIRHFFFRYTKLTHLQYGNPSL